MRRLALLLAPLAWVSCNCANPATQNGTALFVVVELGGLNVDQLATSISTDPTTLLRPESPSGPLGTPQTLRLLLPDSIAGQVVAVRVSGLLQKIEVGAGESSATVVLGLETEVRVALKAMPKTDGGVDAGQECGPDTCTGCCENDVCKNGDDLAACGKEGSTCAACGSNDTCVGGACAGCNSTNCAGCCRGSLCVTEPSVVFCGAGGEACRACPPLRSECRADGECACGNSGVCPLGTRCKNGTCTCDAQSCADGCCEGTQCRKGDVLRCGFAGALCQACDPVRADDCSATGTCTCGSGPQCGAGQACAGGSCICNAASCPNGCCDGNICRARSIDHCGPVGGACTACTAARGNTCEANNGCICAAAGRACGADERCTATGCVCDAQTCPDGCCQNGTCVRQTSGMACGGQGNACSVCPGPGLCDAGICAGSCSGCAGCCFAGTSCNAMPAFPVCANGTGTACQLCDNRSNGCADAGSGCSCGGGPPCPLGQFCTPQGTCACGPSSCAGCCAAGGACVPGNQPGACGLMGLSCAQCTLPAADRCALGDCKCGNGLSCPLGERCDGGRCTCDAAACDGCCSGDTCVPRDAGTLVACGASGLCKVCDASRANQCLGGQCRCGTHAECGQGEACQGGACVCNPGTCNGCCIAGTQCVPLGATNDTQCGSGGAACRGCPGLQRCSNGACCLLDVLGLVCVGSG